MFLSNFLLLLTIVHIQQHATTTTTAAAAAAITAAFTITTPFSSSTSSSSKTVQQMAPGGWGIGNPLDFKDEEYSSTSSKKRRRRRRKDASSSSSSGNASTSNTLDSTDEVAYNAETAEKISKLNRIEDPQEFTQRVMKERNNLQLQKRKDLLEIAKFAGLGDRMDKVNRRREGSGGGRAVGGGTGDIMNGKFDFDDDDDLDVRVQWED